MPMWDIPAIGLAMLATDDKSGEEQNGWALKGLPIALMLALEAGDFFGKLDGGDPTELEELEFFAGEIVASGEYNCHVYTPREARKMRISPVGKGTLFQISDPLLNLSGVWVTIKRGQQICAQLLIRSVELISKANE
ncbi:hypothetical protein pdam_00019034 [Pocillopora damicornis]|uniref:Uncharacterized protein n=1 Tax=Pocillopora damicornis TaxID=46731 RepID=A0A3M6T734_POCDA|nr:hypothetical protein pdam_00019034 [Pocillopora damicornis]